MISAKDLNALARTIEGVPVWGVFGNGPARKAGVQFGDVILSCNGVRTRSIDDYLVAMNRDVDGCRKITVFRDGAEVDIAITIEGDAVSIEDAAREIEEGKMLPVNRGPRTPNQA